VVSGGRVLNEDVAHAQVPLRPMGRIPVIVRPVLPEGVELRPGVAIRWTRTHVMVCLEDHAGAKVSSYHRWLPAADVARLLRLPNR
jgi:hypothetical protein